MHICKASEAQRCPRQFSHDKSLKEYEKARIVTEIIHTLTHGLQVGQREGGKGVGLLLTCLLFMQKASQNWRYVRAKAFHGLAT